MRPSLTHWLVFALLSVVWGSSFILMKEGLTAFSPYQVASLRMLSAGIILLPFAIQHMRKIPKEKMGLVIISGVVGNFIPAYLFCIAETQIDSALAGILNSLTPFFTILVGVIFYKVETNKTKMLGILVGFIGLVLLFVFIGSVFMAPLKYLTYLLLWQLLVQVLYLRQLPSP